MLMCVCSVRLPHFGCVSSWLVVNTLCDVDKPYRTISRFSAACMILNFFLYACILHATRLTMMTSKTKKNELEPPNEFRGNVHCGRQTQRKIDACENWKEQLEPFSTHTNHKHIDISCIVSVPIDPNLCGTSLTCCERRVLTSFHILHYVSIRTEGLRCCSRSHSHYSSSS